MSIVDPRKTGSGAEPDADREREDAPLPTRFGRHGRRGLRPQQGSGTERATDEPRDALDDADPFEDDGGL